VKTIPKSVLKMLEQQWKPTEGHSAFDTSMQRRPTDPSYYHVRNDVEVSMVSLTYDEAKKLDAEGALGDFVKDHGNGKSVAVNEHAVHALMDFCSEVYDAWNKYQDRLRRIPG
jgi:hypothetical protein